MTTVLAADKSANPGSGLILLGFMLVAFYFLGIRPGRRRMQAMQAVQRELGPGREVVTTAGMYGTVTGVDATDGTVTISIAPGVEARFARGAIMKVVEQPMPETIPADDDAND